MFILSNMGKDQEFLEAARNGNITIIEKILSQKSKRSGPLASLRRGPSINVQDSSGYSALHHAALNGHTYIVRLLLAHDASSNLPDSRGSSPLHLAAWAGHQDIVKLFLTNSNKPANPNLQTIENETPLHYAAQHGHTGALTTLLAHGADPNVTNSRNETPLDLAAQYGRIQVVQMLIRAHPELLSPFRYTNISPETVNCSKNKSIVFDHTPLHLASRNGHKSVVEVLLAAGINVNVLTQSGTALHEAALCGKDSIVRLLLNFGADLNATDCEGRTALDILEEFPPHVTKGIVSVINNHRNSISFDNECDETRDIYINNYYATPISTSGSPHENNSGGSPVQNYFSSHYNITTSPSSSVGSFGPPSPSRRPRNFCDLPEFHLTTNLAEQRKPIAPKKPPRRNLSVSPTQLHFHSTVNTGQENSNTSGKIFRNKSGCEYICTPPNDNNQYSEMDMKKLAGKNHLDISAYGNTILKSYNPNRKLKRIRNNICESFSFNQDKITPKSPTNYQQPPTPEHPPPSAVQAEKYILDHIRPLSQEYKKKYGLQQNFMTESSTSPSEFLCSSFCGSSGSISSSISISDHSVSTDCIEVEEFIGDVPFAGLFKGSTINLSNANLNYQQQLLQYKENTVNLQNNVFNNQHDNHRSKILHTEFFGDTHNSGNWRNFQKEYYTKNRSNSFDGVFDIYNKENLNNIKSSISPPSSPANDINGMNNSSCNVYLLSDNDANNDIKLTKQQQQQQKLMKSDKTKSTDLSNYHRRYNVEESDNIRKNTYLFSENDSISDRKSVINENNDEATIQKIFTSSFDNDDSLNIINSDQITNDIKLLASKNNVIDERLTKFLKENDLIQFENLLIENGFDNIEFLNGILDESDMVMMNIPFDCRKKLLKNIQKLPTSKFLPVLHLDNNNTTLNIKQWLESIHLSEYTDIFKQHLCTNVEGICRVWEVELQTVLEINKLGHRKRILHSVSNNRTSSSSTTSLENQNICSDKFNSNMMELRSDCNNVVEKPPQPPSSSSSEKLKISVTTATDNNTQNTPGKDLTTSGVRHNNRKNRPAPKPPILHGSAIEIRQPSELLLGLPSNLQTQWRHSANSLINNSVKYDAYYLGSTIVKELRGTESTRKSIQKLKGSERLSLPIGNINQSPIHMNNKQQKSKKQPIRLSISHRGVEFIDIETQKTICEHTIRNINCACQDADDLSHFAYITKDSDINTHYCHVFNVDSMDLATEIILTLGQAFEVAYQIALRDASYSVTKKTIVDDLKLRN